MAAPVHLAWAATEVGRRRDVKACGYVGSCTRCDAGFGSDLDRVVVIVGARFAPFLGRARDWPAETFTAYDLEACADRLIGAHALTNA